MTTKTGGRGVYQGPDAIVSQNELRDIRRRLSELQEFAGQMVPVGGIIFHNMPAASVGTYFDATGLGKPDKAWANFAICNGNHGTPNLHAKFPRLNTAGGTGTGGNDSSAHDHTVDIDHNHGAFNSDDEGAHTHTGGGHTHAAGTLVAQVRQSATASTLYSNQVNTDTWNASVKSALVATADTTATGAGAGVQGATATGGAVATGAGSNHHHQVDVPALGATSKTTSGASATDNKPAYYELVPVMRVA